MDIRSFRLNIKTRDHLGWKIVHIGYTFGFGTRLFRFSTNSFRLIQDHLN